MGIVVQLFAIGDFSPAKERLNTFEFIALAWDRHLRGMPTR
jgi:hypothetical protein